MQGERKKVFVTVAVMVLVAFVVGSNIAWLNPRPDFELYRTFDSYPFMWQYNADAGMEILSAAYFPSVFETYPERINRPLYPVLARGFGEIVGLIFSPVVSLSPLEKAGAGYVILKLIVHFLAGVALWAVLRRWLSWESIFLSLGLMLLHTHTFAHIATFHTTDLQIFVPIFVAWGGLYLQDRYRELGGLGALRSKPERRYWLLVVVFSLVAGILMLGKQNYSSYLALLATAVLVKRWREAVLSFLVHLAPLFLYVGYLSLVGLSYRNNEITGMDQGVWVADLLLQHPLLMAKDLWEILMEFLGNAVRFFHVTLFLAVAALSRWRSIGRERKLGRTEAIFFLLLFLATFAQFVAVRRFFVTYLTSDIAFIVFGLASWMILEAYSPKGKLSSWLNRRFPKTKLAGAIVMLYGVLSIVSFVNLPYLTPWEQPYRSPEVVENRLEMVENPELFTEEEREAAEGGAIIEPGQGTPEEGSKNQ